MGCSWEGLDYSDARPSYFNLFTESGSSSRSGRNRASSSSSGHNRGAAVEADAIGRRAAAGREAEANGERKQQWAREQQLKRMQAASSS